MNNRVSSGPESSRARIVPDQSTSNGPSPIEQHPSQALLDLMNLLAVCRKAVTELCDLLLCALFFRLKRRLSILECLDSLCLHLDLLVCQGQCFLRFGPFTLGELSRGFQVCLEVGAA